MRMEDVLLISFDLIVSFVQLSTQIKTHPDNFVKILAWIPKISQKGYFFVLILKNVTQAQNYSWHSWQIPRPEGRWEYRDPITY